MNFILWFSLLLLAGPAIGQEAAPEDCDPNVDPIGCFVIQNPIIKPQKRGPPPLIPSEGTNSVPNYEFGMPESTLQGIPQDYLNERLRAYEVLPFPMGEAQR